MILNLTSKPYHKFTAAQVLACDGEPIMHKPFVSIEDFASFYDANQKGIATVIIDPKPENTVINNDICNIVLCKVVTLDVEIDADTGKHTFVEYF